MPMDNWSLSWSARILAAVFLAWNHSPDMDCWALTPIRFADSSSCRIDRTSVVFQNRELKSKRLFGSIRGEDRDLETEVTKLAKQWVTGPDLTTKPNYENINGPLGGVLDSIFLRVFRGKLSKHVGFDSGFPNNDYSGLIELATAMNSRYSNRTEVQKIGQATLRSLFPGWLPGQFAILFSKPFPEFASRMNAWATKVGGTWLMGECEVNDVVKGDGTVLRHQGVHIKRCRFLEESGCASICVNCCKIPTQNFFMEDMGLPLTITPDYETYQCQFEFGVFPDAQGDFDARNTPCLARCPTAGSMRAWHSGDAEVGIASCAYMEDGDY